MPKYLKRLYIETCFLLSDKCVPIQWRWDAVLVPGIWAYRVVLIAGAWAQDLLLITGVELQKVFPIQMLAGVDMAKLAPMRLLRSTPSLIAAKKKLKFIVISGHRGPANQKWERVGSPIILQ